MNDNLDKKEDVTAGTSEESCEVQLERLKQQLISREKLAFIGQLSAGILHEIKNPLNFVNTFSKLSVELLDELEEVAKKLSDNASKDVLDDLADIQESLKINISKVLENGQRAERVILTMLAQSRENKQVEFVPTNINQMVDEFSKLAYQGMRGQDKEFNLSFKTNFGTDVGVAVVDQQDLSRVVLNVVNNACYALKQKKKKLGDAFSPEVALTTSRNDDMLTIKIRDNGTGMPQSVIDKIFNPFFTTKPNSEGTGLGLYLSHDIVTNIHKGKLTVESKDGEFTEFTISVPVNQPA